MLIILGVLLVIFIGGGVVVVRSLSPKPAVTNQPANNDDSLFEDVEENTEVEVSVARSKSESNTVIVTVNKLDKKYSGVEYEITYDSEGLIKGVNSGSKPIDIAGQDEFNRDVYLGTCSRNVCKPDVGVKAISVVLQFTATDGTKTQSSGEYDL